MNMRSAAASSAGRTRGNVIRRNTLSGGAPELNAAASSVPSIEVNAATPIRKAIGTTWVDWTNTMPGNE